MLERLYSQHDVDYVIVHKVDRLARDRADDVAIGLTIHKAGAVLVSASEQIDDTPAGTLLHGIMAAIAEFYSKNLSAEAKKGLHEKARRGGTPGYAPLGYLNATEKVDGREVKTIILDSERAPHVQWAFEAYAGGEWSITDLVEELTRRGLRTRPTATRSAVPLTRSQVHRTLSSSYYTGKLPYGGAEYDGKHLALVDDQTWTRVQDVLSGRRISGDRSWKHDHYLKGSLFCARCGSRLGFGYSKGKGGTYPYFFCLGRVKKRTECELPYLNAEQQEAHVIRHWQNVKLAAELIERIRDSVTEELAEKRDSDEKLLLTQRRRLLKLERQREKLIDAYLAEAIPVADLRKRQEALAVEQRDAERLIELANFNHTILEERLKIALGLLEHCHRLYIRESEPTRRALNQAFFAGLEMDTDGVKKAVLNPPFSFLTDRSIGLADNPEDDDGGPGDDPDQPEPRPATGSQPQATGTPQGANGRPQRKNPMTHQGPQGSNVELLAEREGFEPSRSLTTPNGFRDRRIRPLCHLSERPHRLPSQHANRPALRSWAAGGPFRGLPRSGICASGFRILRNKRGSSAVQESALADS